MLWFVGGYLLIAAAFYTYIVVTAQEDPEEAQAALGQEQTTLAGVRGVKPSTGKDRREQSKPRAA